MRSVLAEVEERARRGNGADVRESIAPALIEFAGYDSAAVWQVDDPMLVPTSVAFGAQTTRSQSELDRLRLNPPLLEDCPLKVALTGDADLAATGCLGSGGRMEAVLGPVSYAVAAVKVRSNPAFLIQVMCCDRRADQFDRDLLMSIAQIVATASAEPEADSRGQSRDDQDAPVARVASGEPLDDPLAPGLCTLTSRERQVLDHALTGATYAAIADAGSPIVRHF